MRRWVTDLLIPTAVASAPAALLTVILYMTVTGIASLGQALRFASTVTPPMLRHAMPIAILISLTATVLKRRLSPLTVLAIYVWTGAGGASFAALEAHASPHISLTVATTCGAVSWSVTVGTILVATLRLRFRTLRSEAGTAPFDSNPPTALALGRFVTAKPMVRSRMNLTALEVIDDEPAVFVADVKRDMPRYATGHVRTQSQSGIHRYGPVSARQLLEF